MVLTQDYMINEEDTFITDFELVEDLIESYNSNEDIGFINLNLKTKAEKLPVGTLLKVNKKIGTSITILSINEVNDKLVSSFFV